VRTMQEKIANWIVYGQKECSGLGGGEVATKKLKKGRFTKGMLLSRVYGKLAVISL